MWPMTLPGIRRILPLFTEESTRCTTPAPLTPALSHPMGEGARRVSTRLPSKALLRGLTTRRGLGRFLDDVHSVEVDLRDINRLFPAARPSHFQSIDSLLFAQAERDGELGL